MADSNVRDALTTLSILFESLMSFSIGSFVRAATLVEILLYVSISSIWLLAIFLESPLFLMRKSCMIEAYEAISFFKNTSKRGTKNYERGRGRKSWLKKLSHVLLPNNTLCTLRSYWLRCNTLGYFCIMEYFLIIHENDKIDVIDVNTGMILILATALVFAFYLARRWGTIKGDGV